MAQEKDVYIRRDAGDLITAEDWNNVQTQIKDDINSAVAAAKQEIQAGKVKEAENSEKFMQKNDKQWLDALDERYAPKTHNHEGQSVYRRYMKVFTSGVNEVFLEHGLGQYPLVDVYELQNVREEDSTANPPVEACKIMIYYGKKEGMDLDLSIKVFRDRKFLGEKFSTWLYELGVDYDDDSNLQDVINDFIAELCKDPNDEIEVCHSPFTEEECNQKRTVGDLKKTDQWEDIYVAIKPRKCGKGADLNLDSEPVTAPGNVIPPACQVEVTQVSYDCLHIKAEGLPEGEELCAMFLLRV